MIFISRASGLAVERQQLSTTAELLKNIASCSEVSNSAEVKM